MRNLLDLHLSTDRVCQQIIVDGLNLSKLCLGNNELRLKLFFISLSTVSYRIDFLSKLYVVMELTEDGKSS